MAANLIGGGALALDTPRGARVALYFSSFVAVLALACAIPHRAVVAPPVRPLPEPAGRGSAALDG